MEDLENEGRKEYSRRPVSTHGRLMHAPKCPLCPMDPAERKPKGLALCAHRCCTCLSISFFPALQGPSGPSPSSLQVQLPGEGLEKAPHWSVKDGPPRSVQGGACITFCLVWVGPLHKQGEHGEVDSVAELSLMRADRRPTKVASVLTVEKTSPGKWGQLCCILSDE